MNAPTKIAQLRMDEAEHLCTDENLRGWAAYCRIVTEEKLPKTILHVCQAVYDAVAPGQQCVPLKRMVLECVADGDCSAAIEATLPDGIESRFSQLPQGRVEAEIRHLESKTCVSAEGRSREAALLGCLIQLALMPDPRGRTQILARIGRA